MDKEFNNKKFAFVWTQIGTYVYPAFLLNPIASKDHMARFSEYVQMSSACCGYPFLRYCQRELA